jgi:hypothetical protein
VLVDPDGYVVAQVSGEGHGPELSALVDELVAEHGGALRRGSLFVGAAPEAPEAPERASALRFPGKAAVLPGGNVLVSDSGQHRLVELEPDLATVHRTVGDGHRGLRDGPEERARFAEPLGLAVLPSSVAAAVGYDVVVADSGNHVLRGVRLADGVVSTVTGTGAQLRDRAAVGDRFPAGTARLSTPWDVAWWDGRVVIAMAGCHQLWAFDPAAAAVWVIAGTGDEGLRDGAPDEAFFAQPSGLAVEADGTLWVAVRPFRCGASRGRRGGLRPRRGRRRGQHVRRVPPVPGGVGDRRPGGGGRRDHAAGGPGRRLRTRGSAAGDRGPCLP